MAARNQVTIYFDNPEQLKRLRMKAAARGMSMAELGKRTLVQALDLPLFLEQVSGIADNSEATPDSIAAPAVIESTPEPQPAA